MDESRKAYEEWFRSRYGSLSIPPKQRLVMRTYSWAAWQASREAIVLDMPEPFKLAKSSSTLTYYYQDEVDAVLSCAGIEVKE